MAGKDAMVHMPDFWAHIAGPLFGDSVLYEPADKNFQLSKFYGTHKNRRKWVGEHVWEVAEMGWGPATTERM